MSDVLSLSNISKAYGRLQALNNVSFSVPEGSVFGILGPNGSGKTTLLSIILDVLAADKGNYLWFGKPGSPQQRRGIGALLETPNFYHYLSAVDNLRVTQSINERGSIKDIDIALQKVKLFERRNSRFKTYSLGMKQRLAIAASLLGYPKVLVLDEPTNGLDPVGIAEIRELIVELKNAGHTVIMASHLLDEVEKVCTHVAILKTGKLVITGEVDEVLQDEDTVELGTDNLPALIQILEHHMPGVAIQQAGDYIQFTLPKNDARPGHINALCFNNGVTLNHLLVKKKRLETRFFELTND